ncbi:MAG: phosphate uptake regulator PhoU, partial [Candidatus Nezhaarchaeota archaeon]|nr:phosphate uptake regulator PhoU [Candidatus Nezhaarchaeota archaeon]
MGHVEYRKLQKTKSGSYLVSIPKEWISRMGLREGATVALIEESDGALFIKAGVPEEAEKPNVSVIELDDVVNREILSKYLMGVDIIHIKAPRRITLDQRERVKNALTVLIGTEIIEEKPNEITIQCLLSPLAIPIKTLLRRAHILALQMHADAITALKDRDEDLAESVIKRDDDLNRLYFLIVRQLRTIIQNPRLSEKAGVSLVECLDYRLAARALESNGDQAVIIARSAIALRSHELPTEIVERILSLSELIRRMQAETMSSLFK